MARAVHDAVLAELPALRHLVDAVAWLDAVQGLAEAAERFHWVRPGFVDDRVTARGLRHPLVEHTVDSYVPSDLSLVLPTRIALITGPNMGGKSTFMRAVAQNAWLAQMGSFVAADAWEQPLLHGIYARIGADDDLARGQSTFMVEMEEMAQILDQADGLSLVLLDELGRGTSTFDGLALAWAILEHLAAANPPPFTLFATHYHELVQLVGPVITPLRTDAVVTAGRLLLLHEVVPGSTSESFGVEVAAQAGIPRSILLRAGRLLRQWERDGRPEPLRSEDQAWLFEPDPVVEELRADLKRLRIPEMTPLEALRWLDEWQRRLS
jgi:DNA mismatch repair protein MutS